MNKIIKRDIASPLGKLKGHYKISVFKAGTKELLRQSEHDNLVVYSANAGLGLITQHFVGTTTYALDLNKAAIGTGTTDPAVTDEGLETEVLGDIDRASVVNQDATSVSLDFFITDAELPDGTYSEFGLFAGTQLFARSLIDPAFTKASGEDVLINYGVEFITS